MSFQEDSEYPQRFAFQSGGNLISIPKRRGMRFVPLSDGKQFFVRYPVTEDPILSGLCLFGGRDESAFLTVINEEPADAYETGGEQGFFDSLRPRQIDLIRQAYPESKIGRQGDIWFVTLPRNRQVEPGWGAHEVLGTNHRLQGDYQEGVSVRIGEIQLSDCGIGEGLLVASDHAPVKLKGEHVLLRTPNLVTVPWAAELNLE